jgi:hypothetical protein
MINTNKIHIYIDIDHMKTAEPIPEERPLSASPLKSVFFILPFLHPIIFFSPVVLFIEQVKHHMRARKKNHE